VEDAEDRTQELFAEILSRSVLEQSDPARGRFRTFLLACCRNSVANSRAHVAARKRQPSGGIISIDCAILEERLIASEQSPEEAFHAEWATSLIGSALRELERSFEERDSADWFSAIRPAITGEASAPAYEEIASACGKSVSAVKVAVTRARKQFGGLLRTEISNAVASPDMVDDELRQIVATLRAAKFSVS